MAGHRHGARRTSLRNDHGGKTAEGYVITVTDTQPPSPAGMSAGPGIHITLEGDNFSYKRVLSTPDGELEIVYSGIVSGDSFTGTGEIGGFSVPYNGVRLSKPD